MEKTDNVRCAMNWMPEIEAEGCKLRFVDDQAFVQQMVEEPFHLKTVREPLDNPKNHVVQQFDNVKQFVITMITRELSRRAECCCCLAEEIAQKVECEIRTTRFVLQPLVLKDKEIKGKKELLMLHESCRGWR